jgi:hypothetical protein
MRSVASDNYPQAQAVDRSLSCECFELASSADQFGAGGCCRLGHGCQRTKVAGTLPELLRIQVAIVLVHGQQETRRFGWFSDADQTASCLALGKCGGVKRRSRLQPARAAQPCVLGMSSSLGVQVPCAT